MASSTPNRIIKTLAPKTLRERWNAYLNNGIGSGEDIDYWNNEAIEIEKALPFENAAEREKWANLGSTWSGQAEWPQLTDKILARHEKYGFDPEQTAQLKKYKGKDYDEAMRRYMGGEGINDILNGLVTYEEQPKRTVGEDLTDFYNKEFFKEANGNRDAFIEHHINRFGIPKGSSRAKEVEHYGSVFDKLSKGDK